MFAEVIQKLVRRSLLVFILLQCGLIGSIYSLTLMSQNDAIYGTPIWYIMVTSTSLLYGGCMLGLFFLIWPLYSIYRKIKTLLRWREWILMELPKLIALIPSLIDSLRKGFQQAPPAKTEDSSSTEY